MRHHNSVFHGLQKLVPWAEFDRLVEKHKADHRTRRLTTKGQFLALLFGQLSGASSLREIEAGLASQSARLYHAGGQCVARSTLADAAARRPAALYADLFARMAANACRRTRRHLADALVILDATRLELSTLSAGWLKAQNDRRAVKLHVAYDLGASGPLGVSITDQRVSDIVPILSALKEWLDTIVPKVLPNSKLGDAVEGANASAVVYSLMLTCRACGVEPLAWLRYVLSELPQRAVNTDITDLLPSTSPKRPPSPKSNADRQPQRAGK